MLNRADYKCLIVLKLPGSDVYGGKVSAAKGGEGGKGSEMSRMAIGQTQKP